MFALFGLYKITSASDKTGAPTGEGEGVAVEKWVWSFSWGRGGGNFSDK